ncbi:hypothetical protein Acr_03g0005710 [Actinidia rufa]|uniref:Leucine-rich repeat-containing N-terminal plant-type domain-containing protein n=1 Tax=Actinidia rufa TaxID=165716 RepID=A0A7J0EDS2_9ERIC|nr:hypothetical protein Acr_03g0005710 [Actinidia rufa]
MSQRSEIAATDCCGWKGVNCDQDGHVIGLDLNSEAIIGGINQSSLFRLQFLESLNLAYNSFKFMQIPPHFGNLTSLIYLNLSNADFAGQIPMELSQLTRLVVLDISSLHFPGTPSLQLENPKFGPMDVSLQKLRFLSKINLGSNNLSAPVPEFFANFRNLTALILSSSNLNGDFPGKDFPGRLPDSMGNLTKLSRMEIAGCNFSGMIPNVALNNFSGDLPPNIFLHWKAMLVDMGTAQPDLNHLRFEFLMLNHFYYQDTVKVTLKGLEMELGKILNAFTSVDFSCNNFKGEIPDTVGALQSLYVLNLSHNCPQRSNSIITWKLVSSWIFRPFMEQTKWEHPETSFEGNIGLCGPPLKASCRELDAKVPVVLALGGNSDSEAYIYISAAAGFVVGLGSFMAPLALCNRWNKWYYKHVAQVLERIFHVEEKRKRRNRVERAYRNPIQRL